jgi:class 3 adenylate cyclase
MVIRGAVGGPNQVYRALRKGSNMDVSQTKSGRYEGTILLADISGYSGFLNDVQDAHRSDAFADGRIPPAYAMLSSLLEGIAAVIEPPFEVVKFEGDAVFALAAAGTVDRGESLLRLVADCYRDFVGKRSAANKVQTCTCNVCAREDRLDLKFIAHYGEYFLQMMGRQVESVGPEVNLAHRLLKNSAVGVIGSSAYALYTSQLVAALALPLEGAVRLEESVDGRSIDVWVRPLTDRQLV